MGDPRKTVDRPSRKPPPVEPHPAPADTASDEEERHRRHWYIDEIVVAAFAFFGLAGGVLLPLHYTVPPITTSFLLATGLAALAYKYLGGIEGASLTIGALKLGGSLAALVGIALLINQTLARQSRQTVQVFEVSGQVLDDSNQPIQPLDTKDIAINPPVYEPLVDGNFKIDVHSSIGVDGRPELPMLSISHDGFDSQSFDLNAKTVQRQGQRIDLGHIVLHHPTQQWQPNVSATPVPGGQP